MSAEPWPDVLAAFREAHCAAPRSSSSTTAGDDDTGEANDEEIDAAQIKGLCNAAGQRQADAQQVHRPEPERRARLRLARLDELEPQRVPRPAQRRARRFTMPTWPASSSGTGPKLQADPDDGRAQGLGESRTTRCRRRPTTDDDHARLFAAPRPRRLRLVDRAGRTPAEAAVHDLPVRHRQGLPARLRHQNDDVLRFALARQVRQRRQRGVAGGSHRRHRTHPPTPQHRHGAGQPHLRRLDRWLA